MPVWHASEELPDVGAVVLPGGFSYGDYLRAGALARFSPAMEAVARFAARRRTGARDLQRLPDPLRGRAPPGGAARQRLALVRLPGHPASASSGRTPPSPRAALPGQRLVIPVKHGEGCWYADEELLAELEENGQILLRYDGDNPNGSLAGVAGVINREGNVMGLMPHPEHAVDPLLGSADGALILESMLDAVRERAAVPA